MKIHTLVFNGFGVNTYVLESSDATAVIIDAACYDAREKDHLSRLLQNISCKPVRQLSTHCHVDHILGVAFVEDTWGTGLEIHPLSEHFLRTAVGYASVFGFELERIVKPAGFINEGDKIIQGEIELLPFHTPGHADGSLCFVCHAARAVFTGDVLFNGSIGRTDLPTGNMDVLLNSIREKLLVLPDDYTVYPGHGPATTIGAEKAGNPFLSC